MTEYFNEKYTQQVIESEFEYTETNDDAIMLAVNNGHNKIVVVEDPDPASYEPVIIGEITALDNLHLATDNFEGVDVDEAQYEAKQIIRELQNGNIKDGFRLQAAQPEKNRLVFDNGRNYDKTVITIES